MPFFFIDDRIWYPSSSRYRFPGIRCVLEALFVHNEESFNDERHRVTGSTNTVFPVPLSLPYISPISLPYCPRPIQSHVSQPATPFINVTTQGIRQIFLCGHHTLQCLVRCTKINKGEYTAATRFRYATQVFPQLVSFFRQNPSSKPIQRESIHDREQVSYKSFNEM
jgi:hypothetical protein